MAQTECRQQSFEFQALGSRKVQANFAGGHLSSDGGGALLLREVEARSGIIARLARCFDDRRDPGRIEHGVAELLAQRINGLAMGYEDLNDHDSLRLDPAHALAAGKPDILGEGRLGENDRGKALAASSTLNRLELAAEAPDARYRKIVADPVAIEDLLIGEGVKAIPRNASEIVVDFDATDDPLHGDQEGAYFNGYYRHYCYLPLYAFCGNVPLWAELRDCKRDASAGTLEALERIVLAIRQRFGDKVRIILRGDGGFCRERIMAWCEGQHEVYYCLGIPTNARLRRMIAAKLGRLRGEIEGGQCEAPARRFTELRYRTLTSWSRRRRVVAKLEILPKGENPRFIVTNLPPGGFADGAPGQAGRFRGRALYEELYCARGEMENRIKEQQLDLFADRTSTRWMASNQLRLWFSAFAHLLVNRLRATVLKGTALERATIGQIRLRLFKIAVRIKVSVRRVLFECCSAYPLQGLFAKAHGKLAALGADP